MTQPETRAAEPLVLIEALSDDVIRVSTVPPIGGIERRFVGRDAFDHAVTLASKAAAGLGYRLLDRTGRLSADECAALLEGRKGAEIVPLASRRG